MLYESNEECTKSCPGKCDILSHECKIPNTIE